MPSAQLNPHSVEDTHTHARHTHTHTHGDMSMGKVLDEQVWDPSSDPSTRLRTTHGKSTVSAQQKQALADSSPTASPLSLSNSKVNEAAGQGKGLLVCDKHADTPMVLFVSHYFPVEVTKASGCVNNSSELALVATAETAALPGSGRGQAHAVGTGSGRTKTPEPE